MDTDPVPRTLNYVLCLLSWENSAPELFGLIGLLLVLLLCSALFSGAEVAYFSFSKTQINKFRESNSKNHQRLAEILEKPKELLATLLVANNFVNIAIILVSYSLFTALAPATTSPLLLFIIQTVIVTIILVMFGEVIPKVYATQKGEKLALLMGLPLQVLAIVFKPINWALVSLTRIIDNKVQTKGHQVSLEEINQAIELTYDVAEQQGEKDIVKGVVNFGNTAVSQIMHPRFSVEAVADDLNFEELLDKIKEAGYSRMPVYKETLDQITGVLYVKDLIAHQNEKVDFDWTALLRPAFFVPEQKKIDDLLKEFQQKRTHMAIVVDEYGGLVGIATLEDVLEEIVGEIFDEFDQKEKPYQQLAENIYMVEAALPLLDVCKIFDLNSDYFDEQKGEAESVGGLLLEITGAIPAKNAEFTINQITFIVEAVSTRKIEKVKIHRIENSQT